MITTSPTTKARPAAAARVEAQLRAYGVNEPELLGDLVAEILRAAAHQQAIEPERSLDVLAAEEVQTRMAAWIDELIGPTDERPAVRFARGRAAIHLARLPEHWPEAMLVLPSPLPPEVRERVRATYLAAGPDFDLSSMVPRPIDLGIVSSLADETWRTFAKWPVLRGAFMCGVFLTLLGTCFYLVRF